MQENMIKKAFYKVWKTKNKILCNGKILTVSNLYNYIGTFMLINLLVIFHESTQIEYFTLRNKYTPIALTFIGHFIVMLFYLQLGVSDPGIIIKISKQYQMEQCLKNLPLNKKLFLGNIVTYKFTIKNYLFNLKICKTCNIYRSPRSYHCDQCSNCYQRYDHHCIFIGNCIAKKNYRYDELIRYFIGFILSITFLMFVMLYMSVYILSNQKKDENFFKKYYDSLIILIVCVILGIILFCFLCFHFYLILMNLTTIQYIKEIYKNDFGNPFCKSKNRNCVDFLLPEISSNPIQLKKEVLLNENIYKCPIQSNEDYESKKSKNENIQVEEQKNSINSIRDSRLSKSDINIPSSFEQKSESNSESQKSKSFSLGDILNDILNHGIFLYREEGRRGSEHSSEKKNKNCNEQLLICIENLERQKNIQQ